MGNYKRRFCKTCRADMKDRTKRAEYCKPCVRERDKVQKRWVKRKKLGIKPENFSVRD